MSETKKAITSVDKVVKTFEKVASESGKAVAELFNLENRAKEILFQIEERDQALHDINKQIDIKEREAKVELDLRVKEHESKVLGELLKKNNLATIKESDLEALKKELVSLEESKKSDVHSSVLARENELEARYENEITRIESEHKVNTANLESENKALKSEINYLRQSVIDLQNMLNAEREARVDMARNQSQPTINVGQNK